ncbi:hypothetical protein GTGU_02656 [Trabulsiella guamensis ATCC 49490]|uniref:Uncharacterized protein n=1 Tax=Trabulsiella guamensis ATCC 49490 TaxID=1005994 RepID=A0A085A7E4_9ENTR|nr:hypothetical protein [Trabulsiella guamensis]KFC06139.1 hypothetical protein GTGU_02656 [Trabulsiella guamensis ATCC 49490]
MSKNIDLFTHLTSEIFALLWENFPVPQVITYAKFNADISPDYLDKSEPTVKQSRYEIRKVVDGTFSFLMGNGYIQYETDRMTLFRNVRLTEKSLTILTSIPENSGNNETIGDNIIRAVKAGKSENIANTLAFILTSDLRHS